MCVFFFGGGGVPLRIYRYYSFGHVLCFVMLSLFPGRFNLLLSNVHLAGDVMSKNPCKLCMSSVLPPPQESGEGKPLLTKKTLVICCICYPVEPRKKPSYFPLYWLFDRDPYHGLL